MYEGTSLARDVSPTGYYRYTNIHFRVLITKLTHKADNTARVHKMLERGNVLATCYEGTSLARDISPTGYRYTNIHFRVLITKFTTWLITQLGYTRC